MTNTERVLLTVGEQTLVANVVLRSPNGRSLGLTFKGVLRIGGGMQVAMIAVLRGDDGTWTEIVTGAVVDVQPLEADA